MSEAELITSVEPDPKGAGGLRIGVNGRTFCTVPAAAAAALSLRPGMVLDEALRAGLSRAADEQAAFRGAMAALGRRGFARRDLERRLVFRGHPRDAARAALDRAASMGLLNDQAFAVNYAQVKSVRGRGPGRLMRDLAAMGVDRGIAEAAIESVWGGDDVVFAAASALARKRSSQLGALPPATKRRRLLAYLARRGFTGREMRAIVSRVLAAEEPCYQAGKTSRAEVTMA